MSPLAVFALPDISVESLGGCGPLAGFGGGYEWLIVLFIALLLFGRRLPSVARSLGQGISSFKKGLDEPLEEEKKRNLPSSSTKQDNSEKQASTKEEPAESSAS